MKALLNPGPDQGQDFYNKNLKKFIIEKIDTKCKKVFCKPLKRTFRLQEKLPTLQRTLRI
jgi:hypothetical protein